MISLLVFKIKAILFLGESYIHEAQKGCLNHIVLPPQYDRLSNFTLLTYIKPKDLLSLEVLHCVQ